MKLKHLCLMVLSAATLAWACQRPERDLSYPSIKIDQNNASMEQASSSFTITVLTNRAWRASADVPWIAIDPESGPGGDNPESVTITVQRNAGYDRSGRVSFDIVYESTSLVVNQAGLGSPDDYLIYFNDFDLETATQTYGSGSSWPFLDQFGGWQNQRGVGAADVEYLFSGISARNNSSSNGNYSDYDGSGLNNLLFGSSNYFVVKNLDLRGLTSFKISFGSEKYDNNNKDSNFNPSEFFVYASDDAARWVPLSYTYNGLAAGRWNTADGTFTVPEGTTRLSLYISTSVSSVYRLDDLKLEAVLTPGALLDFSYGIELPMGDGGGSGGGSDDSEYDKAPAKTVREFIEAADNNTYYKLTGTVSGFNPTYCSFDLTDETGSIYVYSVDNKDDWSSKVSNGGTVTLAGKYDFYASKSQHEVVNAHILSFDGGGVTPPSGDVKQVTVAEFLAAPESNTQVYELVGTIRGSINTTYGNFDLVDDSGSVYVYGMTATELGYGATNDKSYASLGLNAGDRIKVRGYRGSYNDKIELMYSWFIGKAGDDDTPGGGDEPGGGGSDDGSAITWTVGAANQNWAATTSSEYGAGFSATAAGMTVGYFKGASTSTPVTASEDHIRVYKNGHLSISIPGKKITGVELSCKPNAGTTSYCFDLNVADGTTAVADKDALKITWTGNVTTFEADAVNGQVRITEIKVSYQ